MQLFLIAFVVIVVGLAFLGLMAALNSSDRNDGDE